MRNTQMRREASDVPCGTLGSAMPCHSDGLEGGDGILRNFKPKIDVLVNNSVFLQAHEEALRNICYL